MDAQTKTTGIVFNIQRFSVNDGPGIRTTVFLKGCPLRCLWCHNPESARRQPEMTFDASKCVGCGRCAVRCPRHLHTVTEAGHAFRREDCIACGACIAPGCTALEIAGKEMTVESVMAEVVRDRVFYEASGGGMTVSGGEPLASFAFTKALLTAAKAEGLHTCIETSGYGKPEELGALIPLVDRFLYDCKETDPERHRTFTGVTNERILSNLRLLEEAGASVVLRCPLIPDYNVREEHFAGIGALADAMRCIDHVEIEPYHPLGSGKCALLGREYALGDLAMPGKEEAEAWRAAIASYTKKEVRRA